MPTRPEVKNLNANSVEILNGVRKSIGGAFETGVPRATGDVENLRMIGQAITGNTDFRNQFISALVNRIGRVIITSKMYTNPWEGFKKGMLEFGETVEELFVNIANSHDFDPSVAEEEVFKRVIPDVRSAFHTMNYQKFYKVTVSNDQLRQAFLSMSGITDLIGKIIDSLYTGANYDELVTMKYLVARQALKGAMKSAVIPTVDKTNASDIVSTIKGLSNDLEFLSSEYNVANVLTTSVKDNQYLIVNSNFDAVVDVNVLAVAFNMDKAEFLGHKVLIDSFSFNKGEITRLNQLFAKDPSYTPFTSEELATLKTIPCVLVDREWFMVFDNFTDMTEQHNGQGLYWNYFYHVWKTFSVSPFANGVMFTTSNTSITSVTITPGTASMTKGSMVQFQSKVVGTGFVPQGVEWTLNTEVTDSSISSSGLLTVGLNETVEEITVLAKSIADNSIVGTATITIS